MCPYNDIKYHKQGTQSCFLLQHDDDDDDSDVKKNSYRHIYQNTGYSINPNMGVPLYLCLSDNVTNTFDVSAFDMNANVCTLSSMPYEAVRYSHILNYRVSDVPDYWNIMFNFKEFWKGQSECVQNKVLFLSSMSPLTNTFTIWPRKYTALDILIDTEISHKWKILRPVHFSSKPMEYYSALRFVMYRLFCNSLDSPVINWINRRKKRPRKMNCGDSCKMYTTSAIPYYNIFGKGNLIHDIICTPERYLCKEWWNLVDAYINYRRFVSMQETNDEYDIYSLYNTTNDDDYDDDENNNKYYKKLPNTLKKLANDFKFVVSQQNMTATTATTMTPATT